MTSEYYAEENIIKRNTGAQLGETVAIVIPDDGSTASALALEFVRAMHTHERYRKNYEIAYAEGYAQAMKDNAVLGV